MILLRQLRGVVAALACEFQGPRDFGALAAAAHPQQYFSSTCAYFKVHLPTALKPSTSVVEYACATRRVSLQVSKCLCLSLLTSQFTDACLISL